MMRDCRLLALIPARGGSKRLPGKNLRPLGGKPLLVWSIDAAQGIADICDVLVSTDDPAIARVGRESGAYVPWLRPAGLADDVARSADVALHALAMYEADRGSVDGLLLLQPTSPFRTRESIQRGIELFKHGGGLPVLGVSPIRTNPLWTYRMVDGLLVSLADEIVATGSQPEPTEHYVVNGAFYLVTSDHLRKTHSFTGTRTIPLIFESDSEGLDIDTALDFALAECIALGAQR